MDSFKKSKLGELLSLLPKKHRDDLPTFMKLPSLKLKSNEITFFQDLLELTFKSKSVNINFKKLLLKNDISDKNRNHIFSKILNGIYQYLSMELNSPNEMPTGLSLLKFFRNKGMDKNYNNHLRN